MRTAFKSSVRGGLTCFGLRSLDMAKSLAEYQQKWNA